MSDTLSVGVLGYRFDATVSCLGAASDPLGTKSWTKKRARSVDDLARGKPEVAQ